jgi:hypothetical protein
MNEWWKTASATFAGGVVAISLVAIPTFVFLPREFDALRTLSEASFEASEAAKNASIETRDSAVETVSKLDSLVIAIAQADAKPIVDDMFGNSNLMSSADAPNFFATHLPSDVVEVIVASGELSKFRYSDFNGQEWVFIETSSFNQFSSEYQKLIEDGFSRSSVFFITD